MTRRGTALQIVLLVIAVVAAGTLVLSGRTQATLHTRAAEDVRHQALWLARSAVEAGKRQDRTVETPYGPARVESLPTGVRVTLAGARAEVTTAPYQERFEAAP